MRKKLISLLTAAAMLSCCLASGSVVSAQTVSGDASSKTYTSKTANENAVLVNGKKVTLTDVAVTKTGSATGEKADFYGTNAAVLAKGGATLTISDSTVESNGAYANGVFAYGSGTTVNVSDTTINTTARNSGGIMTTGGAVMNAQNLVVNTKGNSSAAIRSDRGGGTVTVTGGSYTSNGVGSPAIYSTADITVADAVLNSNSSEAVVIEGGNSVTLINDTVTGNHKKLNGQSKVNTNVMIYQSMSGDASEGKSSFTMQGGTMTSKVGAMFYVTNTTTEINLADVEFVPASGAEFLTVAAGPWGSSGSNGGNVTLNAATQSIDGKISVDSISTLNLILSESSVFNGSIAAKGDAYVELKEGSKWSLTGDSSVKSLTCDEDSIILNGYTLTVNGEKYTEGTASQGEAITPKTGGSQSGRPPAPPSGDKQKPQIQKPPQQSTCVISKVKAKKKQIFVKVKKVKNATRYQVQIKKKNGKKWSTYTTKSVVTSVKNLKTKTTYQVRARYQMKRFGKWNSSKWSNVKTIKTK